MLTRLLRPPVAVTSGGILALAYPGWNLESGVWAWLYPLLALLWWQTSPTHTPAALASAAPEAVKPKLLRRLWQRAAAWRGSFGLGYLAGLGFFVPTFFWIRHSSRVVLGRAVDDRWLGWDVELLGLLAVLGLTLYFALYFAAWAVFAAKVAKPRAQVLAHGSWIEASLESLRSAVLAAAAWVALEMLRGWVFTGFGWNGLGVGLWQNRALVQAADLVGVAGLSFTPVLLACVVFNTVHRIILQKRLGRPLRYHFDVVVAVGLVAAQLAYGIRVLKSEPQGGTLPLRVALVQLNIPQAERWASAADPKQKRTVEIYRRYADLTAAFGEARTADGHSPLDLIIWPEGAMGYPWQAEAHTPYFNDLLKLGDFSLLSGTDMVNEEGYLTHTGAVLMRRGIDSAKLHRKVHLVPFGEYLPLREELPFMHALLGDVLPGDFRPGELTEPFTMHDSEVQLIPLICFEDTVGRLARRFVRDAPQVIVNMTNDGWFLHSSQPQQHMINAMFRAIELRRPMCRACNTGITSFIDEKGSLLARLEDPETHTPFIEGVLPTTLQVPRHPPLTLYARWGDWFALGCLAVALLAAGTVKGKGRREKG